MTTPSSKLKRIALLVAVVAAVLIFRPAGLFPARG